MVHRDHDARARQIGEDLRVGVVEARAEHQRADVAIVESQWSARYAERPGGEPRPRFETSWIRAPISVTFSFTGHCCRALPALANTRLSVSRIASTLADVTAASFSSSRVTVCWRLEPPLVARSQSGLGVVGVERGLQRGVLGQRGRRRELILVAARLECGEHARADFELVGLGIAHAIARVNDEHDEDDREDDGDRDEGHRDGPGGEPGGRSHCAGTGSTKSASGPGRIDTHRHGSVSQPFMPRRNLALARRHVRQLEAAILADHREPGMVEDHDGRGHV